MLLVVTLVASCGAEAPDAADVGLGVSSVSTTTPILWPLAVLGPVPMLVETWQQAEAEPE